MSVLARLRATRLALVAAIVVRALLWSGAAAAGAWLLASWMPALVTTTAASTGTGTGAWRATAALAAGALVAIVTLARAGGWPSLPRVALWVEEHMPSLDYVLVTAAEGAGPSLEARLSTTSWNASVRRAAGRALLAPAVALSLALAALAMAPAPHAGLHGLARGNSRATRLYRATRGLASLVVTVTPPPYTGFPAATLDDPSLVPGLVGSMIAVSGTGDASEVTASSGDAALPVRGTRSGWSVTLRMPAKAVALRLRSGRSDTVGTRLLALEPRADSEPVVSLDAPARDSVLRAGTGTMALAAGARDDIGLARGAFEYIVSSGSGETFRFRTGTVGARPLDGRRGSLRGSLVLDSMHLVPGDVIHVRAVAADRNDVSGGSPGRSETRSWRVARADEYDSVSVEAAAPADVDKSLVSQRMLIQLAEALEKRRPRLTRNVVVREAGRIATDQARLRRAVGDIIFSRTGRGPGGEDSHGDDESPGPLTPEELVAAAERAAGHDASEATDFEGGESPVVQVNQPLLEAYNAMWDAGRELQIGEPGLALPPMRRALAAIQRARQADRIYLRGRPPAVVVDVNRARLQGRERGAPAARVARGSLDAAARQRAARLVVALELLRESPAAAVDSLLLLRVDALAAAPLFAAALGDAIEAVRRGQDASAALALARRRVLGEPVSSDSLASWGSAW